MSRNKPGCCPPGDVRGSALTAGEVPGLPPDLEGVAVLAPDASPCSGLAGHSLQRAPALRVASLPQVPSVWARLVSVAAF